MACTHSILESVQNFRGGARPRAVVECEHQFLGIAAELDGNCLRPTRGVVFASISMVRSVPSAWGLPGQGSASHHGSQWKRTKATIMM